MTECIQEAESGGGAETDAPKQSWGRVAQEACWELQVWRDEAVKCCWCQGNAAGVREDRKEALKQQSSSEDCGQFGQGRAEGRKQGWDGCRRVARPGKERQTPELSGLYMVGLKLWILSGRQ